MAAPLAKTNEIVILSGEGSRVTGEVNRLLAELPVSVNALTGVDLTKVSASLFVLTLLSSGSAVFYLLIILTFECLNFLDKRYKADSHYYNS